MKRYFARVAESELGHGVVYVEFDGETATRQVERYGSRWFDYQTEYHPEIGPGLVDQPLSVLGLTESDAITREEFEKAWEEATRNTQALVTEGTVDLAATAESTAAHGTSRRRRPSIG